MERKARIKDGMCHGAALNRSIGLPQSSSPGARPASHAVSPFKENSARHATGKA
jgi:hypothetical protein